MPTTISIDKGVKFRCYLICFLAFLLSVSPVNISRVGLLLLLLFAPLMAVYRLHVPRGAAMGWHFLLLLLALSGAVGVVSSGHDLIRLASFLFSLLFWAFYLCCRVCGQQTVPVKTICMIVLEALFSCPAAFFIPNSENVPEARKNRITRWIYMGYILITVLVILVLLLVQANKHISDILLAAGNLVAPRIPLLISCMVLALFPAAVIYSFITQLESITKLYGLDTSITTSSDKTLLPSDGNFPWSGVCVLFVVANWFLLIVEIFYTWYLGENPLAHDYHFYDIFIIYTLILLGMAVMLYRVFIAEHVNKILFVMLGLSDVGLTVIACFRLYAYIKFHGLWTDRVLLATALLLWSATLLCVLLFPFRRPGQLIQRTGSVIAILLSVLFVLPKGFVLTEVNTSIFLHKYNTHQLSAQMAEAKGTTAELSADDLRLDLIEYYGIDGIPALSRLSGIDDITVQGQTLGTYAKKAILDCLCADLKLPRSGNDDNDITTVIQAASFVPRYRLPSAYLMAIQCLKSTS